MATRARVTNTSRMDQSFPAYNTYLSPERTKSPADSIFTVRSEQQEIQAHFFRKLTTIFHDRLSIVYLQSHISTEEKIDDRDSSQTISNIVMKTHVQTEKIYQPVIRYQFLCPMKVTLSKANDLMHVPSGHINLQLHYFSHASQPISLMLSTLISIRN